jgi:hypothetical protein
MDRYSLFDIAHPRLLNVFQTQFEVNIRAMDSIQFNGYCYPVQDIRIVSQISDDAEVIMGFLLRLHCDMAKCLLETVNDAKKFASQYFIS